MMNKIRVLIVDDSAFIRKVLKDILESDQNVEVIAAAKNGKEAIDFLTKQDVDVITLDVEMPIMNGIDTLKEIMSLKPTPVVMLSSLTNEGADMTFKAHDTRRSNAGVFALRQKLYALSGGIGTLVILAGEVFHGKHLPAFTQGKALVVYIVHIRLGKHGVASLFKFLGRQALDIISVQKP